MKKIFTIGFTKKTAEEFFNLLERGQVESLIDIRLNNTSQLAAFSKFPDLEFFLKRILGIPYVHDVNFAPTEEILNQYKKKIIDWSGYESEFTKLMNERNVDEYILKNYHSRDNFCFLCSEPRPEKCHRRLVAERFAHVFKEVEIVHL